jgi:uncharacterized protein (TIGR02594 family)
MTTRRSFVLGIVGAAIGHSVGWTAEETWEELLASAIHNNDALTLGRIIPPSDSPLWPAARKLLENAAQKKVPYTIANYFVTSLPPEFQTAWPEPNPAHPTLANPLIVLFFAATKTKPTGDKTPWCAAFMNWCLLNAFPPIPGTSEAGSQSFKDWGTEVWNKSQSWPPSSAKRGDVAVFRLKSDPAHGHVAFFQQATPHQPNHVDVLGGNQFDAAGSHTFNVKSLNIHSGLELITIRTADGLRNV